MIVRDGEPKRDRRGQFFRFLPLEQIAAGPGLEGAKDFLGVFKNCQHNNLDVRQHSAKLAHAFDAVHDVAAQVDIHQHDVRLVLRQPLQRGHGATVNLSVRLNSAKITRA